MKLIVRYVCLLFCLSIYTGLFGHGGETHADDKPIAAKNDSYFSVEASSGIYEILIRYGEIKPKKEAHLDLFISNYKTNVPADSMQIIVTSPQLPDGKFTIEKVDKGRYRIDTEFAELIAYTLNVQLNGPWGADLLAVKDIKVGEKLTKPEDEKAGSFNWWYIIIGIVCFGLGIGVMQLLKRKRISRSASILTLFFTLLPLTVSDSLKAHGGDDHDKDSKNNQSSSTLIQVPKESQFLFSIITNQIKFGAFAESVQLFGTVIPSSGGEAIIASPLTGKITTLSISVGQKVKRGQILATMEQTLDVPTQINLLTEKNNLKSEYEAAQKEYDRLMSISNIAAQKDIDEAKARMEKAKYNLEVLTSSAGRTFTFKAPIDGVVGNFTLTLGSIVNSNEVLFAIYNLTKVYVETQVYDKDIDAVYQATRFTTECADDNHKSAEVKLLSPAQTINPTNQSQRVLFEMENPDAGFKIGEFVYVRAFQKNDSKGLSVANSSITEINGKPAVFVKRSAEVFELRYVQLGNDNGRSTLIVDGITENDRIVDNGVYQLKMMYMNQ